uniref:hypothetical protein n=1 Tax=Methanobrevibacter smithii TaxID=2173 RepID=UPI0037DD55DE
MSNRMNSIEDRWKEDNKNFYVGFSTENQNLSQDTINNLIDKIDDIENKINNKRISKDSKIELKRQVKALDKQIKNLVLNESQIEENLDEGLPSESGKYDGMSYKEILERAIQMENDAIEINLMLLEIAPTKDAKKLVEIANDENDHSQIYQGLLNKI